MTKFYICTVMPVFEPLPKIRYRDIPGFGGRYQVGDDGSVLSRGTQLSLIGGRYVNLSRKGVVSRVDVAYLVARAFLSNLRGCERVIHLDGDLKNNRAENLEWSDRRQPAPAGRPSVSRPVAQFDMEGHCVRTFRSVSEASAVTGVARSLITGCAAGRYRKAGKWYFRYA